MNLRYIQWGDGISQGVNKPKSESEKHRGQTSQGANQPKGEQTRGRTSQGANRQKGENITGTRLHRGRVEFTGRHRNTPNPNSKP